MTNLTTAEIVYPDTDDEPMAENDLQFRWIVTLQGGFDALFRDDSEVIVKGDMLWYPVEGHPEIRVAPDVMVIFGRPKGNRGSYQQWKEGGVAPQVVFEVLSPGNRAGAMAKKLLFYEEYGVEEYYVYDPDDVTLEGYLADPNGTFGKLKSLDGFTSPRLGVRFELADELVVHTPDGGRFRTYLELVEQAERDRAAADQERQRAEQERQRAEQERQRSAATIEALLSKLRAAGIDPDGP